MPHYPRIYTLNIDSQTMPRCPETTHSGRVSNLCNSRLKFECNSTHRDIEDLLAERGITIISVLK